MPTLFSTRKRIYLPSLADRPYLYIRYLRMSEMDVPIVEPYPNPTKCLALSNFTASKVQSIDHRGIKSFKRVSLAKACVYEPRPLKLYRPIFDQICTHIIYTRGKKRYHHTP